MCKRLKHIKRLVTNDCHSAICYTTRLQALGASGKIACLKITYKSVHQTGVKSVDANAKDIKEPRGQRDLNSVMRAANGFSSVTAKLECLPDASLSLGSRLAVLLGCLLVVVEVLEREETEIEKQVREIFRRYLHVT